MFPTSLTPWFALALVDPDPGFRLDWDAPAECADAAAIEARLADAIATASGTDVRVAATVTREGEQLHLRIDRDTASGHEHDELASARCDVLVDVVVLLASIALDPALDPRPTPAKPQIRGALGVLAAFDLGTLPRPSFGVSAKARVFGRWWSAELRGHHQHDQRVVDRRAPPVAAEVAWWAVGLRGCGTPGVAAVVFPLCLGSELGGLRGHAVGSARARTELWAAVTAGTGVVWSLAPRRLDDALALVFDVEAVIALRRPGFHLLDRPAFMRAGAIALRVGLGLEGRFGRRRKPSRSR